MSIIQKKSGMRKPKPKYNVGIFKCTYPGCDHTGALITKAHCRINHEMERDKMFELYGEPEPIRPDPISTRKNLKGYVPFNGVSTVAR